MDAHDHGSTTTASGSSAPPRAGAPRSSAGWRSALSAWPVWAPLAAIGVLTGYAVAALVGMNGGPPVFAAPTNPENVFGDHWLAGVAPVLVQPIMAAAALGGVVVLLLQLLVVRAARVVLLPAGAVLGGFLALVLPGNLSLDAIPVWSLLNLKRFDWPTVHLVLLAYTGIAIAASTLAYARRVRRACVHCGRRAGRPDWTVRRWSRIGLVASIAAFVTPFGYASSRVLWAVGIPLGTTPEFLAMINAANPGHGTVLLELILVGMAAAGGLLCFGLTRPWSETWPRWVPGLAGRPVPHWFPVGLAVVCGVGLTGYGTQLLPDVVRFVSGDTVYFPGTDVATTWVSHVPALALVLWGPLVLVSALAFHYRTRDRCTACHLGRPRPVRPIR